MPRIVIPVDANNGSETLLCEHFGRAAFFAIAEYEGDASSTKFEFVPNQSNHFGGRGTPAENMIALKPDAVIAGGMGRKAIAMMQEARIPVMRGKSDVPISALVNEFAADTLDELTEGCKHAKHG